MVTILEEIFFENDPKTEISICVLKLDKNEQRNRVDPEAGEIAISFHPGAIGDWMPVDRLNKIAQWMRRETNRITLKY